MTHHLSDKGKIELVKEAVKDCQRGVLTPLSAIIAIGGIIDPVVVTDQMLVEARQWVETQGLENEALAATDHLQQAKFHLERAIVAEWKADLQAMCGIGHALVALVERLQSPTVVVGKPFTTTGVLSDEDRAAIEEAVAEASGQ